MHPIILATHIEESYRRYLQTTFYFRDPELRGSFEAALGMGGLSKGPYLEATPVFRRTHSPRELFAELLGKDPDAGFLDAIHGDRPLYLHQEQAIRHADAGHNVVVSTGTGSGKTESFLYPILLHLYREFLAGQLGNGVRAMILYPMNALANDQRERLGEIAQRLEENNSPFRFTFGQYIGETPEDARDSRRNAQAHIAHRLPGELVLRSEMRNTPPQILLTNYSMLEYLLLRPQDSPLFDEGAARWWDFLVLDEAHQYRGARGMEMALLLRRLKQRLRVGGRENPFRCIATSATLVDGSEHSEEVASFASDLFGEPFRSEGIIFGEEEPIPEPGPQSFSPTVYQQLADAMRQEAREAHSNLACIAANLRITLPAQDELPVCLGRILQQDARASRLRRLLADNPGEVAALADQLFEEKPAETRPTSLSLLVALLLRAKDPDSGAPLLSVRYHLFLRALEGAFVSYWPQKQVFIDRKSEDQKSAVFEVALCRECGQHYFVGRIAGGKFVEALRDPADNQFGATYLRPLGEDHEEAEEDDASKAKAKKQTLILCLQCGKISRNKPDCGHEQTILVVQEEAPDDSERADQLQRCGACGYSGSGRDPVREVVQGTDGPHAVIATTLAQHLPAQRRKILAFADGRQNAAYFAWYLENSYKDILTRNLIIKALQNLSPHAPHGVSPAELVNELQALYQENRVFPPATGSVDLNRQAWLDIYRELLTDEPRISLEGVGLLRWEIQWPEWFRVPELLRDAPYGLSESEARELLALLLNTMRKERAVELRSSQGAALRWSDLGLQASQYGMQIGPPHGHKNIRSWDGNRGRRVRYLTRLLTARGMDQEEAATLAVDTLRSIWDSLRRYDENAPRTEDCLLLSMQDARRLNPDWFRARLVTNADTLYQCDTCGRLQGLAIFGICANAHCSGRLQEIRRLELPPNHYRALYEENLPGMLHVEEHTAQLDHEKAREFQREFRDGKINVLSCSTTFELGVDLGDLDTIFLRNVPPEAFNYAQRVGRCGRRSGSPGFAVTYCRRNSHDLYHFAEPRRMLSGKVHPPVLCLQNEKITSRHIAATALSAFFRAHPERFQNVAGLLKEMDHPSAITDFRVFLQTHQHDLEKALRQIVPDPAHTGVDDGSWVNAIAGDDSRFALAELETASDYQNVVRLEESTSNVRDYRTAEWAQKRAQTIANEDILSLLSRKAVIPKYGFPVDVVELDTQSLQQAREGMSVLLQRDLAIAISEFAPTSKLIANKKLWTSYALKRVAGKEWPLKYYKCCHQDNFYCEWEPGQPEPPTPCKHHLSTYQYIVPSFGFVTERKGPEEPTSRPQRLFTTRPYFIGLQNEDTASIHLPPGNPFLTMKKASPGAMVVLCEGRFGEGFYICDKCGAGFRKAVRSHTTPFGQRCNGTLSRASLGHQFVTDVLQLHFHSNPVSDIEPIWFAYSLAYALVEGAAAILDVPSTDLNATVSHGDQGYLLPPILLYDNVPGGAGLVARLENEAALRECLEAARERVSGNCGCADNTSCYGCLRSYWNQFAHPYLQRGPVKEYLDKLLSSWR